MEKSFEERTEAICMIIDFVKIVETRLKFQKVKVKNAKTRFIIVRSET